MDTISERREKIRSVAINVPHHVSSHKKRDPFFVIPEIMSSNNVDVSTPDKKAGVISVKTCRESYLHLQNPIVLETGMLPFQ